MKERKYEEGKNDMNMERIEERKRKREKLKNWLIHVR